MALKLMRGFRYFLWLLLLLAAVITVMWLTKTLNLQEGQSVADLITSKKGGVILAVLVLLSASYPLSQFAKRTIDTDLDADFKKIEGVFAEYGYVLDRKERGKVVFRARSSFRRLRLSFNDEITVTDDGEEWIELEGMKRDMYRIHSKLMLVLDDDSLE